MRDLPPGGSGSERQSRQRAEEPGGLQSTESQGPTPLSNKHTQTHKGNPFSPFSLWHVASLMGTRRPPITIDLTSILK